MTGLIRPLDQPAPLYRRNVALLVLNRDGLVWVGRRIDTKDAAWQVPQGGIDPGESPEQAALRELTEETSMVNATIIAATDGWLHYDLPPDLASRIWGGKWRGQAQIWYALRFTGHDSEINLATKHPEFDQWRWVPRDTLVDLAIPFKRPVYAAALAALGPKLDAETDASAKF